MMNDIKSFGKKRWAFAAGHIPLFSTGHEPTFTSHDKIAILNFSEYKAEIEIQVFYEDVLPVVYKKVFVAPRRLRKIRLNDLIDPIPIPLDTPFGFTITSDEPVIVQFSRMNTGSANLSGICTNAFTQSNE